MLRVCVLGEQSIIDGRTGIVRIRWSRTVALIGYLAAHAGSPQIRQHIPHHIFRTTSRRSRSLATEKPPGRVVPQPWHLSSPGSARDLSALARNCGDVWVCGQAASAGAGSWAARRLSRSSRSDLVNFHSNGVAICW